MAFLNRKLLVDAVFINNSGGLVLLKYLINQLEKNDIDIVYLLDIRVKNILIKIKKSNDVYYIKNSLFERFKFYYFNKNTFNKVLCFGNLPPSIKMHAAVYTYFHQLNYLRANTDLGFINNCIFFIKKIIFKWHINFTDYWIVQTKYVKDEFILKYSFLNQSDILTIPFYPPLITKVKDKKLDYNYLYVSSGVKYKNHINLLSAFCLFYDEYKVGTLYLTVSNDFPNLLKRINILIDNGYPIVNIGNVDRSDLKEYYSFCKFIIYPSNVESLGLGVIEGIENDCFVIGPNLPWIKSVCIPSIEFNPESVESIFAAFNKSKGNDFGLSKQLTFNEIDNLLYILKI